MTQMTHCPRLKFYFLIHCRSKFFRVELVSQKMNFPCLAFLFFAQTCFGNPLNSFDDDWSAYQFDGIFHRMRRDANKTQSQLDPNTRCVIRNLKDIESKLDKSLPPERNASKAAALAKPHQLFSNSDPNTLLKFCTIYKASRSRLAACGDSQMKIFAVKALAVVDFICIDRYDDFIAAFPCIQRVDQILDGECKRNCSQFEGAADKLNSAGASIVKKYSSEEIKELFAQSCQYVRCFMECQKPMLASQCGEKVLELEMISIAVTFRNLDDLMNQSSASSVWPKECRPLSSMGHDLPVKKIGLHKNSSELISNSTSAYPSLSTQHVISPTLALQTEISNSTVAAPKLKSNKSGNSTNQNATEVGRARVSRKNFVKFF